MALSTCSSATCNAQSPTWCVTSPPPVVYICDTAQGIYVGVGSGGGGTPGGQSTQVQFNNSGAFGGDAGMTYNSGTDTLTLAGNLTLSTGGATVDGVDLNAITDANVSNTLTASIFQGSGTTTDAIDLATAEVAGTLPIARGGTNATAQTADRVLITGIAGGYTTDADFTYSGVSNVATINGGLVEPNKRTVHICAAGCEYTTLSAACAAETSTAANPITYRVHAGTYAATNTMCTGEDNASFVGDGIGVTTLQGNDPGFGSGAGNDCGADPQACKGAINTGTSTDIEITGFTLKGNRGVWMNGVGTGGGNVYIHHNEFITTTANGDEDCVFWRAFAAGSEVRAENNICTTRADGFTVDNDATTKIYSEGNVFHTSATVASQVAMWTLRSIPCFFYSRDDLVDVTGGSTSNSSIYGYQFDGNPGDGSTGCAAGTAVAVIQSPAIRINNTSTGGAGIVGSAIGITVSSTGAEMGRLEIHSPNILTNTDDSGDGVSYGVNNNLDALTPRIYGGRIRATGGAASTSKDITGVGADPTIITFGTDYEDEASDAVVNAGNWPYVSVSKALKLTGTGQIKTTDTESNIAAIFGNLDPGNNENGAVVQFRSSEQSPENFYQYITSSGQLNFDTSLGVTTFMRFDPANELVRGLGVSRLALEKDGAHLEVGDATGNTLGGIWFRTGSNPMRLQWNQGTLGLVSDVADKIRLTGTSSNPTMANDGEIAIDETANQLLYFGGGAVRTLNPVENVCHTTRGIAATDDNFIFWMVNQAVTVTSVGCRCVGTCSTLPTFTLEDNDGNAMTITGTNPTCATTTTEATYAAVTAGGGLVAGEGIAFDTTNTPVATTDWITICVTYTVDRQ
jgi:hypothetical protein